MLKRRKNTFESNEGNKELNFLSEDIKVTLSWDDEVGQNLPEVTDEDIEAKQERFCILMGRVVIKDGSEANIEIQSVIQKTREDFEDPTLYKEGVKVVHVNLAKIIEFAELIKSNVPDCADQELVGDIHTHPVRERELNPGVKPWHPSQGDIGDIVKGYKSGSLSSQKPYIFGIAVQHEGETSYAFYRMVLVDGVYKARMVNR